eukprot:s3314_g3.t1
MLHVLIRTLLGRLNPSSRDRLLDLALKWRAHPTLLADSWNVLRQASTAAEILRLKYPTLGLWASECLGLFVEAGSGLTESAQDPLLTAALPALGEVLKKAEASGEDPNGGSQTTRPRHVLGPWQVPYAVAKSLERVLGSAPQTLLGRLLERSLVEGAADATAFKLLWTFLLGPDAFASERHPWVVAVTLRCLESQTAKWRSASPPRTWLSGEVTARGLLRALEALLLSERLEHEVTLAPLAVKAFRGLALLLLEEPSLVPEASVLLEKGGNVANIRL